MYNWRARGPVSCQSGGCPQTTLVTCGAAYSCNSQTDSCNTRCYSNADCNTAMGYSCYSFFHSCLKLR